MYSLSETATPGRGKDLLQRRHDTTDEETSCGGSNQLKSNGDDSCIKGDSDLDPNFTEEVTIYIGDEVLEPEPKGTVCLKLTKAAL